MFDLARDVMAEAYRGNPRLPALPDAGGGEGAKTWMPATSAGRVTARCFDLIGTHPKARSRQVLGD
jgi:hypothetical protein